MALRNRLQDICRFAVTASIVFAIFLSGCSGSTGKYENTASLTPPSEFFSDTDLKLLCTGVAEEISQSISSVGGGAVVFFTVNNRTSDRIDMLSFTEKIATSLISSSSKIKVLNKAMRGKRDFELNHPGLSPSEIKISKEMGADFAISGRLSSITNKTGRNKMERYFLLSVFVTDVESGIILRAVERELKKKLVRSSFTL